MVTSKVDLLCGNLTQSSFVKDPGLRSRGSLCTAEAKVVVKNDLENICIENIQACILIGSICLGNGDPNAKSLYFGTYALIPCYWR